MDAHDDAMDTEEHAPAERDDDCTTTRSFRDHGIGDGADLITRTHYRLLSGGITEFEPTPEFFERLESAFVWAYLASSGESGVPDHVRLAVDDARSLTLEEFADAPDADLRTDVVPAFYRRVAGLHCVYRG